MVLHHTAAALCTALEATVSFIHHRAPNKGRTGRGKQAPHTRPRTAGPLVTSRHKHRTRTQRHSLHRTNGARLRATSESIKGQPRRDKRNLDGNSLPRATSTLPWHPTSTDAERGNSTADPSTPITSKPDGPYRIPDNQPLCKRLTIPQRAKIGGTTERIKGTMKALSDGNLLMIYGNVPVDIMKRTCCFGLP